MKRPQRKHVQSFLEWEDYHQAWTWRYVDVCEDDTNQQVLVIDRTVAGSGWLKRWNYCLQLMLEYVTQRNSGIHDQMKTLEYTVNLKRYVNN